jgi:hypothetical protein
MVLFPQGCSVHKPKYRELWGYPHSVELPVSEQDLCV